MSCIVAFKLTQGQGNFHSFHLSANVLKVDKILGVLNINLSVLTFMKELYISRKKLISFVGHYIKQQTLYCIFFFLQDQIIKFSSLTYVRVTLALPKNKKYDWKNLISLLALETNEILRYTQTDRYKNTQTTNLLLLHKDTFEINLKWLEIFIPFVIHFPVLKILKQ